VIVGEPDAFTVPEGLDWSVEFGLDPNEWGDDPAVVARIETDADHHGMVEHAFDGAVTTIGSDGRAVVEVTVRHYVSFIVRVLGFGTHARVVEPPELVERTRAWLLAQSGGA
jgi:predicted DNA-binding transcriptional regulator YafY